MLPKKLELVAKVQGYKASVTAYCNHIADTHSVYRTFMLECASAFCTAMEQASHIRMGGSTLQEQAEDLQELLRLIESGGLYDTLVGQAKERLKQRREVTCLVNEIRRLQNEIGRMVLNQTTELSAWLSAEALELPNRIYKKDGDFYANSAILFPAAKHSPRDSEGLISSLEILKLFANDLKEVLKDVE